MYNNWFSFYFCSQIEHVQFVVATPVNILAMGEPAATDARLHRCTSASCSRLQDRSSSCHFHLSRYSFVQVYVGNCVIDQEDSDAPASHIAREQIYIKHPPTHLHLLSFFIETEINYQFRKRKFHSHQCCIYFHVLELVEGVIGNYFFSVVGKL